MGLWDLLGVTPEARKNVGAQLQQGDPTTPAAGLMDLVKGWSNWRAAQSEAPPEDQIGLTAPGGGLQGLMAAALRKTVGFPVSREAFQKQNPHSWHPGYTSDSRAGAFDALPPEADVWVYHATDPATAARLLKDGVAPETKPPSLARERYEQGGEARFQPGQGLGRGLYVGSDPFNVEGYGRHLLAIRVKKGDLGIPPEQATLGTKSVGEAMALSDAQIAGPVRPEQIFDITSKDATSLKAYDAVQRLPWRLPE